MLFAMLKSNTALHGWFGRRHGKDGVSEEDDFGYPSHFFRLTEIWEELEKMPYAVLLEELYQAAIQVVMQDNWESESRRAIADHTGISLQEEWRITEEYLDKKTIAEILAIGEEFGVFEQKEAQTFLYETLLKKRGNFKGCKKAELKRVFLESGVDLAGVVPAEILAE